MTLACGARHGDFSGFAKASDSFGTPGGWEGIGRSYKGNIHQYRPDELGLFAWQGPLSKLRSVQLTRKPAKTH